MSAPAIGYENTRVSRFWNATVGKKVVMAVTGFALFGFIVGHLLGNLNFFRSVEAMNAYARFLRVEPALLWAVRGGLLVIVLLHIWASIQLTALNRMEARPVGYVKKKNIGSNLSSRSMIWSGLMVLFFVIYHLMQLTWGVGGTPFEEMKPSENLVAGFSWWPISVVYLLGVGMLMMHLYHGIWSMFQSLGFSHPRYTPMIRSAAKVIAIALFLGFSSIPVAILLGYRPPLQ